jgi:Amt family ammonium transporter
VHLFAGVWGTLAVPLTNPDASIIVQIAGVGAIGLFATVASALTWISLKRSVGLRLTEVGEALGIDAVETGMRAYPEFETANAVIR